MLAALGISMLGAQVLFIEALRHAEASYVVLFFYTTLVFAALYDMALFGDRPDLWSRLGIAIILAGVMLLAWRERRRLVLQSPGHPQRGKPT
jgi:drug/metabolite transporter (DMT)-like permease